MMEKSATLSKQEPYLNLLKKLFFFSIFIPLFFSSCNEQKVRVVKWIEYEPIYMTEEEFNNAAVAESPRDLVEPGKIYIYQDYLFVNEINKGIHIFDNSNPASPTNLGFINIPLNKDLAIRNELLYADSFTDILVFDIANIQNPELLHRKEDVYNIQSSNLHLPHQQNDTTKGIIVDWKEIKRKEVCSDDYYSCGPRLGWNDSSYFSTQGVSTSSDGNGGNSIGKGGSMARFAITGNFLYAVDEGSLTTFDISSTEPVQTDMKNIGARMETIFPYKNYLYLGSLSAMYIYDISTPENPQERSEFSHFRACDPVVVEDDIAYVTLRTGAEGCPRISNRLVVIDVRDPENPREIKSYEMKNPYGLGIDGDILFVSEGDKGIKVFDASVPGDINMIRFVQNIKSFDVIPFNNVLMVTGKDGIIQYDYSNIKNIKLLSVIPAVEESESEF